MYSDLGADAMNIPFIPPRRRDRNLLFAMRPATKMTDRRRSGHRSLTVKAYLGYPRLGRTSARGEKTRMREDGEISVTLLLNGGHIRTLYLRRRDPLLSSLVSSISEKSYGGGRPARPFNIRLDEGRRSIMFSSTDLVGLVTDPPLQGERDQRSAAMPAAIRTGVEPAAEKSPYLLLENFVEAQVHAELLKFVLAHEADFATAAFGRPPLLPGFQAFSDLFRESVRSLVPQLVTAFGIGAFAVGEIDCALAVQRDGAGLGRQSQDGSVGVINFLYTFHGEAGEFSGGEFRLYGGRIGEARPEGAAPVAEIRPKNNSILLFPSQCPHEVLPLRCPTNRFAEARFAVFGTVRRGERDDAGRPSLSRQPAPATPPRSWS
jgi:SM-20-related protein